MPAGATEATTTQLQPQLPAVALSHLPLAKAPLMLMAPLLLLTFSPLLWSAGRPNREGVWFADFKPL